MLPLIHVSSTSKSPPTARTLLLCHLRHVALAHVMKVQRRWLDCPNVAACDEQLCRPACHMARERHSCGVWAVLCPPGVGSCGACSIWIAPVLAGVCKFAVAPQFLQRCHMPANLVNSLTDSGHLR